MALLEKTDSAARGMRQVIQDLVAPELRELKVEVRAINERLTLMDERFDRLDHRFDRMDERFDRMDQRFERMEQSITNGFEGIRRQLDTYNDVQQLKERVIRMEAERGSKPAV